MDDKSIPRIFTKKDWLIPWNHEIIIDVDLLKWKLDIRD